jgi:hypothetical protein
MIYIKTCGMRHERGCSIKHKDGLRFLMYDFLFIISDLEKGNTLNSTVTNKMEE